MYRLLLLSLCFNYAFASENVDILSILSDVILLFLSAGIVIVVGGILYVSYNEKKILKDKIDAFNDGRMMVHFDEQNGYHYLSKHKRYELIFEDGNGVYLIVRKNTNECYKLSDCKIY